MANDPYTVLGVQPAASQDEIRKAFHKLAKALHPDVRPSDKAAADRFKEVSAAYDLLGDADKRRRFDAGEIDEHGEPRRAYGHQSAGADANGFRNRAGSRNGEFGFSDMFSDLFGGPRTARQTRAGLGIRGQDVRYTLEVDFLESVSGTKKRVTMPEGGLLDLVVPEGVSDGQVLRLKGKGSHGFRGGEHGDALVEIRVRAHPDFQRSGDDILVELPIAIDEAVLGARVEVPTITGRVQLTIPKATSSGRTFRLRGKGVRNATTGTTGDQLVSVRIELPETIDEKLSYFLSEWRQTQGYNPRDKG